MSIFQSLFGYQVPPGGGLISEAMLHDSVALPPPSSLLQFTLSTSNCVLGRQFCLEPFQVGKEMF